MDEAFAAHAYSEEEGYRIVADYTYDWKYWLGPDGLLRYMSPSCERITDYRLQEFDEDPRLPGRIVHEEDSESFRLHEHLVENASFCRDTEVHDTDFRIRRRDGEIRWIAHI